MGRGTLGRGSVAGLVLFLLGCGDSERDVCGLDDADGVTGGDLVFDLTVGDDGFSPSILAAQDSSNITLTLRNAGTKPHGFTIDCMPTPNQNGCPMTSCFSDASSIAALVPGSIGTAKFVIP